MSNIDARWPPPKTYLQRQLRSSATIALKRIFKRVDAHLSLAGDRVSVVLRTFTGPNVPGYVLGISTVLISVMLFRKFGDARGNSHNIQIVNISIPSTPSRMHFVI